MLLCRRPRNSSVGPSRRPNFPGRVRIIKVNMYMYVCIHTYCERMDFVPNFMSDPGGDRLGHKVGTKLSGALLQTSLIIVRILVVMIIPIIIVIKIIILRIAFTSTIRFNHV